jgi:hypothetical protein
MRKFSLFICYALTFCTTPAPVPPKQPEIIITSVSTTNPVVIEGRARTFENNVILRLRDASGALIRETFTTAAGEMGQHNPFRAEIYVTRDPEGAITVEALEYSARDGSARSLTSKTIPYEVEPIAPNLYFHDPEGTADCSAVFPVRRYIPKSVATARLLVEALIDDPFSPFPRGSRVKSVTLRDGVLTVDFNERLQNVGGSCAAQAIRAAVQTTLWQLRTVERVIITADGSETLALQP